MKSAEKFDFSEASVAEIRKYIKEKGLDLDGVDYKNLEPIPELMIPILKETLEYAGIVNPTPQQLYMDAMNQKSAYLEAKNKIAAFAQSMSIAI